MSKTISSPSHHNPKNTNLLDKAAGLESHQFARDQHRFNAVFPPINYDRLPRQPRVGQNTRNKSDIVFAYDQFVYPAAQRFDTTPVVEREKHIKDGKKEKLLKRIEVKR